MKGYAYRILNVFAREGRLTGNPLLRLRGRARH